jgi:hypothetical protein
MLFYVGLSMGVFLIPTIIPIYSRVLVIGIDRILTVILHLRRDFLFNHTTCHDWLRKFKGVLVPVTDRCSMVVFWKFGRISSQLGGISSSTGKPP